MPFGKERFVKLYHTTSAERAAEIAANGFDGAKDHQGVERPFRPAILFTAIPRDCNDGLPPHFQWVFVVDFPDSVAQYQVRLIPEEAETGKITLPDDDREYETDEYPIPPELANQYFTDRRIHHVDHLKQSDKVLQQRIDERRAYGEALSILLRKRRESTD